jgi:hypothetical protein
MLVGVGVYDVWRGFGIFLSVGRRGAGLGGEGREGEGERVCLMIGVV